MTIEEGRMGRISVAESMAERAGVSMALGSESVSMAPESGREDPSITAMAMDELGTLIPTGTACMVQAVNSFPPQQPQYQPVYNFNGPPPRT